MTARDAVLSKIRRAIGVTGGEAPRRMSVAERLAQSPKGVIPARAQIDHDAQIALFVKKAEASLATVERVAAAADVPEAVAAFLRRRNLPAEVKRGADPRLAGLPWERVPQLTLTSGRSDGQDLVGLSHAEAGVAETGTLALASGPDNPTTLNFLPDYHLVVVDAADVVGDLESVWARLRAKHGKGLLPRTVNFVTGPSRSGDIEQKLLLGAHGPRSLHVILVG
ncbi:LutC/YkgG family protein [Prosthecomicrobium pneumaticum]|uniref:L-lactate dehydrogenase complex protein LldG n=1 Tax=Prosthecomicrobium pneumaticum TaxID=81895 RepID=A0A7W9CUK2_9HYPH|nr:lactate utilization protein [Prosthecomicrobium pneumaticum]MBB5752167.1 L-lactate dehydrogenase complex protein LldG [Prosthecomicrobium pneumaticum]